jgi:Helix-turn-helix of DDE superfamily endonuclease
MKIEQVLQNNRLLAATIGISKKEFEELLKTFTKVLQESRTNHKRERKVGGGRNGNIKSAQNKLFFILFYLKTYPTYDVAAYVFASSKTRTHIWVKEILPLLEKTLKRKIVLPQRQIGSVEEFLKLFPEVKEVLID